jgi:hypothetical protein
MAKLKTVSIYWSPGVFGGTIVVQGRASHLAVQLGQNLTARRIKSIQRFK